MNRRLHCQSGLWPQALQAGDCNPCRYPTSGLVYDGIRHAYCGSTALLAPIPMEV